MATYGVIVGALLMVIGAGAALVGFMSAGTSDLADPALPAKIVLGGLAGLFVGFVLLAVAIQARRRGADGRSR
jgi:hypothetical protein